MYMYVTMYACAAQIIQAYVLGIDQTLFLPNMFGKCGIFLLNIRFCQTFVWFGSFLVPCFFQGTIAMAQVQPLPPQQPPQPPQQQQLLLSYSAASRSQVQTIAMGLVLLYMPTAAAAAAAVSAAIGQLLHLQTIVSIGEIR